jgi:hypothetical protein
MAKKIIIIIIIMGVKLATHYGGIARGDAHVNSRGYYRGHCIPNNASMYLNGTCQTANAMPAVIPL